MQSKYIGIFIVISLAAVGGYFLLRGNYQSPTSGPSKPAEIPPTTQTPVSQTTEISVVGKEFSFSPASISVKAGARVKITFSNNGKAPHNLILEGLGIGTKTIKAGQADVVEFTAPSSGTYVFFCSVPGHRAAGMEGSLKVQ
ncbi:MAG: cupredoxin domain-containing protein [Patescibacteria group bacterium]